MNKWFPILIAGGAGLYFLEQKGLEAMQKALTGLQSPPYRVTGEPVTVVIPTWNEEVALPPLLTSIRNQTYQPIEIILSDWHSDDRTHEVGAEYNAKVVEVDESGVGPARNFGAKHASSEIVMFSDADCILQSNLVERLVQHINDGYVLAHPRIGHFEGIGWSQGVRWAYWNFVPRWAPSRVAMMKKVDFDAIGGYKNIWREDKEIGMNAGVTFGFDRLAYVKDVVCATGMRREKALVSKKVRQVLTPEFPGVREDKGVMWRA